VPEAPNTESVYYVPKYKNGVKIISALIEFKFPQNYLLTHWPMPLATPSG